MIHPERIQPLNTGPARRGHYVLYWMQASQRTRFNHALEFAIERANEAHLPLVVFFGITDRYPNANARHYAFMLQGLREVDESLRDRGIRFIIRRESPELGVLKLAKRAALVVTDRGYLRIQRDWRRFAADRIDAPLFQVETDVVVPVETASPKEEYMAATLRPKIHRHLIRFLAPLAEREPEVRSLDLDLPSLDLSDPMPLLDKLKLDRSVAPVDTFIGGQSQAEKRLREFIRHRLARFAAERNDPNADALSNMSPYLHFGQVSPIDIARRVREAAPKAAEKYLEELIVRRELSMNFVFYNPRYDEYAGLPDWCRRTLDKHRRDPRPALYDAETLEAGRTADPYWNAAQREMVARGKMHGYMRMYWGKKLIEWSRSPEDAFRLALALNDKYEFDGRDPNGYTGVAWCFGKHDRPWSERPVFGNIRYMAATGLRRKFDADRYAASIP